MEILAIPVWGLDITQQIVACLCGWYSVTQCGSAQARLARRAYLRVICPNPAERNGNTRPPQAPCEMV
ncbi:MAG: hypothetical protein AAFS10_01200 [Myxococcota bacterium]